MDKVTYQIFSDIQHQKTSVYKRKIDVYKYATNPMILFHSLFLHLKCLIKTSLIFSFPTTHP